MPAGSGFGPPGRQVATRERSEGNNGSGASLQTGEVDGDTVSTTVENAGTIQGRGDADSGNTIGDDILHGGRGDDDLEGRAGADRFVFEAEAGFETVTHVEDDADALDLASDVFGFGRIADVLAAASEEGDDVVIDLGDEGAVTLLDDSVAQLSEDTILF